MAKNNKINLATASDIAKARKIVINLQQQTDTLTRRDIADWHAAWQMALNIEHPNRQRLYDIYRDSEIDGHLSGAVGQVCGYVKARSFKMTAVSTNEEDTTATELFNAVWFKDLLDYILQARYWGHSLVQLGDPIKTDDGKMTYSDVTLLPRKHVVPEYGRITELPGDDWRNGIDYRQPPYSNWLIEVGKPTDLGLYLKAAPSCIAKRHVTAFWDMAAETFGMPMRIAKTSSVTPSQRREIEKAMDTMGTKFWAVLGMGDEIQVVENSRGDFFNIYDRRIDRADNELSKLILLQTMTIDNGSSLSQSQTHLDVLKNLVEELADRVRDVVNDQLLPRMLRHGFPVAGLRFDWDYAEDYTPEQMAVVENLAVNNYEVPGSYFEEKYGIPAGNARERMTLARKDFFD